MTHPVPDFRHASGECINLDLDLSAEFCFANVLGAIGRSLGLPAECLEVRSGTGHTPTNWHELCDGIMTVVVLQDKLNRFLSRACNVEPGTNLFEETTLLLGTPAEHAA